MKGYRCGDCGETFTRLSVFDSHRTGSFKKGDRHCLSSEEMEAKGMRQSNGKWTSGVPFWREVA